MITELLNDWANKKDRFKTLVMLVTMVTLYSLISYFIICRIASWLGGSERSVLLLELLGFIVSLTVLLMHTYQKALRNFERGRVKNENT